MMHIQRNKLKQFNSQKAQLKPNANHDTKRQNTCNILLMETIFRSQSLLI